MATQKAFASYQEITDLHTESDKVSVIGIHTPQGDTPRKMFGGFFDQFKKFKYLGASVTLVPAARLPVDPLGVSYEAGEPTIDPRDVLNPILFHGCHGNDMGSILNKLYGNPDYEDVNDSIDVLDNQESTITDSVGTLQRLYYMALTDNTWRKAHPQKGFKKSGLRPLVYSLASTRQIAPSQFFDPTWAHTIVAGDPDGGSFNEDDEWESKVNATSPQLITPRLTSLGWLDTRNVMGFPVTITDPISSSEIGDASFVTQQALALQQDVTLPKIFMGVILLPPAYKTEQYFRMIINHHFAFKGFRGISLRNDQVGNGALPGNVVNANGGFSDNANADGWIEGDIPFEPGPGPSPDPPEPPEPPEPTIPTYTYDSKTTYHGTNHLYTYIRSEGLLVDVITSYHPEYAVFCDLFERSGVKYPAYNPGDGYIYYLNGTDNKVYQYNTIVNSVSYENTFSITSESPTGYTAAIFSGDYVLEEYLH